MDLDLSPANVDLYPSGGDGRGIVTKIKKRPRPLFLIVALYLWGDGRGIVECGSLSNVKVGQGHSWMWLGHSYKFLLGRA